jgi:colicin import membrane protein
VNETTTMSAAQSRDPLLPRRPKGMGKGLALALLAHALLIVAIAFGVNWRAHEPAGVEAELWSAVPQAAAPRAVAPEPQPAPPVVKETPPPPPPKAETPPPRPAPDPQIAIEKAKREEAKKLEAKRLQEEQEQAKREKARREAAEREEAKRKQAEQEKQRLAKEEQERKKREAAEEAKLAAARADYLKRMQGMAGATGGETATGTALRSSGPSASYAGRIVARIKPNIVLTDTVDGNPTAEVELKVAPDGTILGRRLARSSGVKAWDDAVLRAIDRTEVLPRDVDGRVPSPMTISFRLRDAT